MDMQQSGAGGGSGSNPAMTAAARAASGSGGGTCIGDLPDALLGCIFECTEYDWLDDDFRPSRWGCSTSHGDGSGRRRHTSWAAPAPH